MCETLLRTTPQQCPSPYGRYTLVPREGKCFLEARPPLPHYCSVSRQCLTANPRGIPVTPCEIFDDEKTISRYYT